MEGGVQEFEYQLMTIAAAERQRQHTKNENNSENKEQNFAVEDLLDFPNNDEEIEAHDDQVIDDIVEADDHPQHAIDIANNVDVGIMTTTTTTTGGNSTDSSSITVVDRCYAENEVIFQDHKFDNELCVPYDDLAELEWLSNFVEESFSTEDLQKLQFISGQSSGPKSSSQTQPNSSSSNHHYDHQYQHPTDLVTTDYSNNSSNTTATQPMISEYSNPTIFNPELAVPAKARSKRSRAAPCNWTSRLLAVSPTTPPIESELVPTPSLTAVPKPNIKSAPKKKGCGNGSDIIGSISEGRKCLHCSTDKTPQWRTGPMGPKTLCNACGVRFKSGRLVPEYRPAASPTFVLTKHSNSHRKVMELRRQKEVMRQQHGIQQCQSQQVMMEQPQFGNYSGSGGGMIFDVTNADDYLIHQHVGPDFRTLI